MTTLMSISVNLSSEPHHRGGPGTYTQFAYLLLQDPSSGRLWEASLQSWCQ